MWVIDTNVISALRRPERAPAVENWLRRQNPETLFLSVVTLGEIERGITQQETRNPAFAQDLRQWLQRTELLFADRILPFDPPAARIWGQLSARIGHGGADLIIAASALAHGMTVVTRNVDDFAPSGVPTFDPFAPC
ncbi:type II toxin-antitoxin system VapC family toxin [Paracoccus bogoriensis]|uniref:type II toxin-antitoxin system VapC family toxin n=1 Tax=Paracoccus bogoriensis TaxID=242065 RepID=UPI001C678965|nr:type II toxin-antitoxin system VapC family toxin [Paracoccus bogoriensis]MBW7057803.1 type II toxin-antitoxin system VapC family toxin [Paracoccus bogoriensis]